MARARGRGLHGHHIAGLMMAGVQGDDVRGVITSGVCGLPCTEGRAKHNGDTVGLYDITPSTEHVQGVDYKL